MLRPCHPSFLAAYSREQDFYKAISYQKHFLVVTCNAKHTEGVRRFREIVFFMALCCCMEAKTSQSSRLLIRGLMVGSLSTEKLQKNCISVPQMTTGALAVCCHLLSSLRCTDATCPQTGLLAKLQVMVVPDGWPTWHCGWKWGALAQQCLPMGRGKWVERWPYQRHESIIWRDSVL